MAEGKIKGEPRWTQILGETSENGTYTLSDSLANYSELLVQFSINNVIRASLIVTISQFRNWAMFPDFTLGSFRGYCNIKWLSDTSIQISESTLSTLSGKIRILAK